MKTVSSKRRLVELFVGVVSVAILFMAFSWSSSQAALVTRTWDGGGSTNNWSEPANWSGDVVPTANDDVVFDSTSTKSATVDVNSEVRNLNIAAAYTGTITISSSTSLTVTNATVASQAGGSIVCGSGGTLIFNNSSYAMSGGSINCANGTINSVQFLSLTIAGGTFTAPLGTMTLGGNSTIAIGSAATFTSNGTILANGDFATLKIIDGTAATLDINNLTIDLVNASGAFALNESGDKLRVNGTLTLARGDTQGTYEALGPVNISNTWGTGNQAGKLVLAGNATRTVTLPTLAPLMSYVHIELNAQNTTVNTSGPGPVRLKSIALASGILSTGAVPFSLGTGDSFRTSTVGGGAFICGGLVSLNAVELVQVGGVFNCENGTIDSNFVVIRINAGIFEAPAGTMTLSTPAPGGSILERGVSGTFNTNNGTVIFTGGSAQIITPVPSTMALGNLTLNVTNSLLLPSGLTLFIDNLNQQAGQIIQGNLSVSGNMSVGAGVPASGNNANITFAGSSPQAYSNNGGANLQGDWTINKSGGTLTLQSPLDLTGGFGAFNLSQGTITTGANVVDLGTRNVVRTDGRVIGNLKRRFTVAGIKTFDVGTANGYAPVSVNVTTLGTNPSDLTVGNTQGTHPVLPPNISLGRFWSITESGNVTANLTFNYLQSDVNGNEGNYKVNRIVGNQVEVLEPPTATVDTGANTATVNAVTEFSDWTLSGAGPPLVLGPLNQTIGSGFSIQFNATGGVPPYTFSIPTNNSGANINAATGFYVAGGTFGVQDTVQVTDSNNASLTTSVTVIDPFLVVNTNDSGQGSYRQALLNANATAGHQTIRFNIPGPLPHTISPASGLPLLTEPTTIDGTSQPGYAGVPVIELNGENTTGNAAAIEIQNGNGSTIQGLAVNRFGGVQGILVRDSSNVTIRSNYIGVGLDGVTPRPNGSGVVVVGVNTCVVGGHSAIDRNVISANLFDGLVLSNSNDCAVLSNYIGVGADGTSPAGNGRTGIQLTGGASNIIGSPTGSNIIAFTGTVNPPVTPRGGIVIEGAAVDHIVVRNSIHSNVGLGIDIAPLGINPNDNCDGDDGPNNLRNFPVLVSATTSGSATVINGTVNSLGSTGFTIQFYWSPQADPSGNGEGKTFIGTTNVTTSGGCVASFSATFPNVTLPAGSFVTATMYETANGPSSEFSAAIPVTANCNFAISPTSQAFNANGGNGTFTINTDQGCEWSAVASDPFISIVSTPNGSGSGAVNFIVAPNSTGAPRTGSITVGGQTFTITQASECVYSINPTAQNFGQAGGTGTIDVQTNPGCAWTAASNNSFITITNGSSGNGAGTVNYSVLSSSGPRSGTITVAGRTFTMSQSGNPAACNGTTSFRTTISDITQGGDRLEFTHDINRDGILDLVYTRFPGTLVVLFGKGDATYGPGIATVLDSTFGISEIDAADLNGDAVMDLVLKMGIPATQQRELRVALGNGAGGFAISTVLPLPSGGGLFGDFKAGEFNGDGKQDLVFKTGPLEFQVAFGNGDGTFASPLTRQGALGGSVQTADLNRDGKLDLISSIAEINVFLGSGDGSFVLSSPIPPDAGSAFSDFVVADFNRDSKLDIAATHHAPQSNVTNIRVFRGNGSGGFGPAVLSGSLQDSHRLRAADFNRDGKLDVLVTKANNYAVFLGNGTGSFSLGITQIFVTINNSYALVGDVNHDGKPDIVFNRGLSSTVFLLNSCGGLTQKPKIDFDGDGKSDIAIFRPSTGEWYVLRSSDGSYFSFQFGLGSDLAAAADFDGDNKTDAAVFRPSTGEWFVLRSSDAGATITIFGTDGDRPAPGDYDGDGITDFAVFRPSAGQWWVRRSSDNGVFVVQWGVGTDVIIQ